MCGNATILSTYDRYRDADAAVKDLTESGFHLRNLGIGGTGLRTEVGPAARRNVADRKKLSTMYGALRPCDQGGAVSPRGARHRRTDVARQARRRARSSPRALGRRRQPRIGNANRGHSSPGPQASYPLGKNSGWKFTVPVSPPSRLDHRLADDGAVHERAHGVDGAVEREARAHMRADLLLR